MKKLCLLLMLQLAALVLFAQPPVSKQHLPEPVNPMKDKQDYQGYTIRLLPALPTPQAVLSYGFDILKDNKPVVHQVQNPLPSSAKGIQDKQDAYKIAQWMIGEHTKTGNWPSTVPTKVAEELRIQN